MAVTREKPVNNQVLNSWKEIARYLNRGVRTVQRWEAELGLPVRRPRGKKRSAVIAMRSEIDEWLSARPLAARDQVLAENSAHDEPQRIAPIAQHRTDLIRQSRDLRADVSRTRHELIGAVGRLVSSIQLLGKTPKPTPTDARTGAVERVGTVGTSENPTVA